MGRPIPGTVLSLTSYPGRKESFVEGLKNLGENSRKETVAPLRYPGFPVELGALAHFKRLSLMKAAYAVVSSAAKQEIRVRSVEKHIRWVVNRLR